MRLSGMVATAGLTLAAAALSSSCQQDSGSSKPANLFSEHQALTGGAATAQAGERCFEHGVGDCATAAVAGATVTCLHVKPQPDDQDAWVCTRTCSSDEECPLEFTCRAAHPDPSVQASYCVPPTNWTPKVAQARPVANGMGTP